MVEVIGHIWMQLEVGTSDNWSDRDSSSEASPNLPRSLHYRRLHSIRHSRQRY